MATTWKVTVSVMDEDTDLNIAATTWNHRASIAGCDIGDYDREELRRICDDASKKIVRLIETRAALRG